MKSELIISYYFLHKVDKFKPKSLPRLKPYNNCLCYKFKFPRKATTINFTRSHPFPNGR